MAAATTVRWLRGTGLLASLAVGAAALLLLLLAPRP
tara:strand:+ start:598 stop:705 length:108 start_codon:yes stop_codon:yes gene_type:complete